MSSAKTPLIAIGIVVVLTFLLGLAGSQGSETVGGLPLYGIGVAIAVLIQIFAYIPAAIAQTERFYDAVGASTYISVTILLLVLSPNPDLRAIILTVMISVWAARLGSFLFLRTRKAGKDDRFDELKVSKLRFLMVWMLQALWVTLTASAAWIAISSSHQAPLGWTTVLGVALWVAGFAFEVTADMQKSRFKADPSNDGKFIDTGLWSRSRHPNYFGEIVLWIGVLVVAIPVLQGWQWVAVISPVFVWVLLTKVSGVPQLEKKGREKWGHDSAYLAHVARTPSLIPRVTSPTKR